MCKKQIHIDDELLAVCSSKITCGIVSNEDGRLAILDGEETPDISLVFGVDEDSLFFAKSANERSECELNYF